MFTDALTFSSDGSYSELSTSQQADPAAAVSAAKRAKGFIWLNLINPDEVQMRDLAVQLDLHPLAAADAGLGRQQPKVQSYTQHLFVVMWTLLYSDPNATVAVGETYFFLGSNLLVTVQRTPDKRRKPEDLRAIVDSPVRPGDSLMAVAYSFMAATVDDYTEVATALEVELEELEKQVFDNDIDEDSRRIYRLRRKVAKVGRAVSSLSTALQASRERFSEFTVDDQDVEPYLRDLLDDVVGTAALTADQNSALDGLVSTHENNVASRQNVDTRKISAFAALLAIPAVVAGLYGMNFKNLPGVNWAFGWLVVVGAIVVLDGCAAIVFKRRHWI